MNKRLQQFLAAENISQSQFADSIHVARASVSHILAGRNKPGYDFLESMAARYPLLNLEWLISGRGKMFKGQEEAAAELLAEEEEVPVQPQPPGEPSLFDDAQDERPAATAERPEAQRRIARVVVFYDNGTYREIS